MNIGKELINILKTLTDSEVEHFDMILSTLPETDEFFEELTGIVEPLYEKYGFNEEYLGKMFLYYLGLHHGIEVDLREVVMGATHLHLKGGTEKNDKV